MRHRGSLRLLVGAVVSMGLLAIIPAVALAADPACGDTLTTNTTLTADLDCSGYNGTGLTLGAGGITLNLNGHTLTGPAGDDSYYGVYTTYNNDTITNGTIADYDIAVYVSHAKNDTVSWLTVAGEAGDTNDYGLYIEGSLKPTIAHNTITGEYYGMYLYGNAASTVKGNDTTANDSATESIAYYLYYDTNDVVQHNTAHAPYGFYDEYGGDQTYMNNTANGGGEDGFYIYCDEEGHATLIDNTANDNAEYGFYTEYCYDSVGRHKIPTLVKGNTANGNAYGFFDYYSRGATFSKNVAKNNAEDGFYLEYPIGLTVSGNVVNANSGVGIYLEYASGSSYGRPKVITGNTIKSNGYGVYADHAVPDGVCHGNVFKNNGTDTVGINC